MTDDNQTPPLIDTLISSLDDGHSVLAVSEYSPEQLRALQTKRNDVYRYSVAEDSDASEALIDMMREQVLSDFHDDPKQALSHQAKLLDIAFRRLLSDADTTYLGGRNPQCYLSYYAAAFQAQDQYRRTIKMMAALNKRGPYNKKGHRKQRVKRNEISLEDTDLK